MTISGERTEQLDIFCRVTGFRSDFISFIDVELIRFFHGAIQLLLTCKCVFSLVVEKELGELLKEVFDDYESDTSDTQLTADACVDPNDLQLLSTDDVDTPVNRSGRDQTQRTLRSSDRGKHNDDIDEGGDDDAGATSSSRQDAESDAFRYPGHIPPLKYDSV